MPPYLLMSDQHAHAWSQFAKTGPDGVNTRLRIILDELIRGAAELEALRGRPGLIVFAGDLFHVRGSIDPEVFNPVHETIRELCSRGFQFLAIPGNHDLKSKDTTALGNAMQTLGALNGFKVVTLDTWVDYDLNIAMIPWCASYADLRERATELAASCGSKAAELDLIIHAGINGVLKGLPDHGLDPAEIAGWGFKRVFAGHYHHHAVFEGGKVVSIGATTHHTYSDIGAKAGYLIVHADRFDYRASHAPSFVEVTAATDPDEIELHVQGNYVRVRDIELDDAEVQLFRKELLGHGALGVTFQIARKTVSARGAAPAAVTSLEHSVDGFIDKKLAGEEPDMIAAAKAHCTDILSKTRSLAA